VQVFCKAGVVVVLLARTIMQPHQWPMVVYPCDMQQVCAACEEPVLGMSEGIMGVYDIWPGCVERYSSTSIVWCRRNDICVVTTQLWPQPVCTACRLVEPQRMPLWCCLAADRVHMLELFCCLGGCGKWATARVVCGPGSCSGLCCILCGVLVTPGAVFYCSRTIDWSNLTVRASAG